MKRIIPFIASILLFSACNNEPKAPYSFEQYDSIMMDISAQREAAILPYAQAGKVDEALAVSKPYKQRFDSVFAEQRKYYPVK